MHWLSEEIGYRASTGPRSSLALLVPLKSWGGESRRGQGGRETLRGGHGSDMTLCGLRASTLYQSMWKYLRPVPTAWPRQLDISPARGNGLLVLIVCHLNVIPQLFRITLTWTASVPIFTVWAIFVGF